MLVLHFLLMPTDILTLMLRSPFMPIPSVAIARRWFEEVWNQRRDQTIDELLTPASICHTDEGPITGPMEFREKVYIPLLAAFPDIRVIVESVLADGDDVAIRWSATGCHTGDGLSCAPTHREVLFRGLTWIRFQDGKLMEGWQSSNIADVVRGLAAPNG
jgi:predicted ester cyclase